MTAWYEAPGAHEELAALMRWLADRGQLTIDDAIALAEKPWHFELERDAMLYEEREDAA